MTYIQNTQELVESEMSNLILKQAKYAKRRLIKEYLHMVNTYIKTPSIICHLGNAN